MKNRDLSMTDRLYKNKTRKLLRECLEVFRYSSEGDLLLDTKHKAELNIKENYHPYSNEGKLLNEIDRFLCERANMNK